MEDFDKNLGLGQTPPPLVGTKSQVSKREKKGKAVNEKEVIYLNYSCQVSPSLAEVEKRMAWKCGSRWNYMIATSLIIRGHATKASDYDYS